MTIPLTPVPVLLPATVNIPADGELVNSASVSGYVQAMINADKYQRDLTHWMDVGGTVAPSSGVNFACNVNIGFGGGSFSCSNDATVNGQFTSAHNSVLLGLTGCFGTTKISQLVAAMGFGNDGGTSYGRVPRKPLLGLDTGTIGSKTQIQPAVYDWLVFPPGTLSTSRFWQLSDTGFPSTDGDFMRVYNGDAGSNTISMYDPGGTLIGVTAAGKVTDYVKISGVWHFGGGT